MAVVQPDDWLVFASRPQQRRFINPVRFGKRHAESGAEGVSARVIDRAVTRDHRYRAIGEVAKGHAQVAVDQLVGAISDDDVDTTALFIQWNDPVRAVFIATGRRRADVIPVGYRRA